MVQIRSPRPLHLPMSQAAHSSNQCVNFRVAVIGPEYGHNSGRETSWHIRGSQAKARLRHTDRLETDPSLQTLFDGAGGAGLRPPLSTDPTDSGA